MKPSILFLLFFASIVSCKKTTSQSDEHTSVSVNPDMETQEEAINIIPIHHAAAILEYEDTTIYLDPTGGLQPYKDQKKATLVCITDIHEDHMNIDTLDSLDLAKATIIVPQAVAEKLPAAYTDRIHILNNGETKSIQGITIEAIPMYNLREEALQFHRKGRGNGYILTLGDERVYFSGDTEDIPEMRALQNIDKAFICMNLPYTMTVESAADAVLAFQPKTVYPYHYRGKEGLSDIDKFKEIVTSGNANIKVVQLDWYPSTP